MKFSLGIDCNTYTPYRTLETYKLYLKYIFQKCYFRKILCLQMLSSVKIFPSCYEILRNLISWDGFEEGKTLCHSLHKYNYNLTRILIHDSLGRILWRTWLITNYILVFGHSHYLLEWINTLHTHFLFLTVYFLWKLR